MTVSTDELRLREALAGRYSIERELGRGGMGVVYLARDLVLERPVALKVLRWDLASTVSRERFLREARTAAALAHPNIVPIHAVDEVGGWILIAMAFVDGETLASVIRSQGVLSVERTCAILRDVALALAHAHRRGVVHRDVKPENILLDREGGRAMLVDFGIALVQEASALTHEGHLVGTPHFMSPEQASGGDTDGRSDLYSLGVVAHLCLTGHAPFTGASAAEILAQHLTREPPPIRTRAGDVPPDVALLIDRCLHKSPSGRPEDAEVLARGLDLPFTDRTRLPVVLRDWVGRRDEVTLLGACAVPLLGAGVFVLLDFLLQPWSVAAGRPIFDDETGLWLVLLLPIPIFLARRLSLLRQALRAGYNSRALADALDAVPGDSPERTLSTIWPRAVVGAVLAGLVGLLMVQQAGKGWPGIMLDDALFFLSAIATAAGLLGGTIAGVLAPAHDLPLELRRAWWRGPFGKLLARLVEIGIRHRGIPEYGDRRTELAIGSAAMVLYQGLPRDLRRRLDRLPETVRQLELAAARHRRRLQTLEELPAGGLDMPRDGEGLEERRAAALDDLREARARATARLRSALTALEVLRLDLLRLHAREADVASITAGIESALALGQQVDREESARWEVEDLMATATPP